jgi:hypothetical protein
LRFQRTFATYSTLVSPYKTHKTTRMSEADMLAARELLAGYSKKKSKHRAKGEKNDLEFPSNHFTTTTAYMRDHANSLSGTSHETDGWSSDSEFDSLGSLTNSMRSLKTGALPQEKDKNDGGSEDRQIAVDFGPQKSRDSSEKSAPRIPLDFTTAFSSGKHGVGVEAAATEAENKSAKKKKAKKSDDSSASVVPHKGAGGDGDGDDGDGVKKFGPVSMSQLRVRNFLHNHNIRIDKKDEIDLENTSCESEDSDEDGVNAHGGDDDDDDDEFFARKKSGASTAGDFNDDPLEREFNDDDANGGDDDIAKRIKDRKNRRNKRKRTDKVASHIGRMNNCFLCKWGKRSYDQVNNEHMDKLYKLIYENWGEIPLEYIAMAVHGHYKNTLKPAAEGRGQKLPIWRSKHVFICLKTHNQIPQFKLIHDLNVLETMQGLLERKIALYSKSNDDDVPVRHLMKELRDTMTLIWRLRQLPMSKMNFHKDDRNIQMGGGRQFFGGLELQKMPALAGAPLTPFAGAKKQK